MFLNVFPGKKNRRFLISISEMADTRMNNHMHNAKLFL